MWIEPALDVFEEGPLRVLERAEAVAVQQFAFYGWEDTLVHRIGKAVADRSPGRTPAFFAAQSEGERGILRSLVGMMDQALETTLPQGHIQSIQDQLGVKAGVDRPSHDAS